MNQEPAYIPEPEAPLTTDQKLDKILEIVGGHTATLQGHTSTLQNNTSMLANLHTDVADLKTDVKGLRETVDSHTSTLDGMAKRLDEVATNTAGLIQSRDRHEKSINQLATKVGVKLDW